MSERHHASGSGLDGHFDPELTIAIPRDVHDEIHAMWRGLGIDTPGDLLAGPAPVARVELQLRRIASTLDVVDRACREARPDAESLHLAVWGFLPLLSAWLQLSADELAAFLTEEVDS